MNKFLSLLYAFIIVSISLLMVLSYDGFFPAAAFGAGNSRKDLRSNLSAARAAVENKNAAKSKNKLNGENDAADENKLNGETDKAAKNENDLNGKNDAAGQNETNGETGAEKSAKEDGAEPGVEDENSPKEDDAKETTVGFETDITSKYIWYGIPLSKGGVALSSLWLEQKGWTYMVYGNFDLTDRVFNQFNLYVSKALTIGALETEFAVQSYFYPHTEDSPMTNEFILTLTKPYKNFSLYLSQSWDIKTYKGAYIADLGVSIERAAGAKGLFKSAVYLEYGSKTFNEVNLELPKAAINSAGAEVSYTYTRKDGIYFRPHAEYSVVIDKDLKDLVEKPDTLSYGFAVGKNF